MTLYWLVFWTAVGCFGIADIRRGRAQRKMRRHLLDLLQAEYAYWAAQRRGSDGVEEDGISLGAMGAIANVLAAVQGVRAPPLPRHPRPDHVFLN